MRRNFKAKALSARHYQNFAWFSVGLGVLAGLSGESFAGQSIVATSQLQDRSAPSKPASLAVWSKSTAIAEANVDSDLGDLGIVAPAPDMTALNDPKSLAQNRAAAKPVSRGAALPNPGQIDRLVAASRERSGGVDQGDEPSLGQAS